MSAQHGQLALPLAEVDPAALYALDASARGQALDPRRSLLLQAPAGSGKTTVLTARFLALLATVQAPEEIVAITFTRKAAAEMRQRILAALLAQDSERCPAGIDARLLEMVRRRDRELRWDLMHNPARLRIQTIDALNHALARALPVAARSTPSLHVADAPIALYRLAARRCLKAAWSDPELLPAAELLFARLDNRWLHLETLLAEMLACRSHWLPRLLRASGEGLDGAVCRSLESMVRNELACALTALPAAVLAEGCALLAEDGPPLSAQIQDLPRWRALAELARIDDGDWRSQFTQTQGFARGDAARKQRARDWIAALRQLPQMGMLLDAVRELPDLQRAAADETALQALAPLLKGAAAELKLVFAESGRADHTEVAAAARASLTEQGDPSEFGLRAGAAMRHILVDEVQDTSLEQFEMLRALTAGWSLGDGRTLFLVGDPMQSIYQFREAEVGLFLRARDQGLGELRFDSLQLRRNFRASAALIDWINQRFARLFPLQDDARTAAVRYLPSVPAGVTGAGPCAPVVALHRFERGDERGEAQCVLEIVQRERLRDPQASIAVLVAGRDHATATAQLMREAGLAVRGVDLEPLRDRPVVRDLSALTRALLHGADRSAWLALLRAPWCGLTLAQLEWLCAQDQGDLFATLRAQAQTGDEAAPAATDLRARLERLCNALQPALLEAERTLPLWQRVGRCWLRLAGPAIYPDEVDRLDAERFVQALAAHELPETLVGEALAQVTDGLYSAAALQPGAIDILTMHAAKGLEWDVVILPGLGRTTARDQDRLLHWFDMPRPDGDTDLLLAPIRAEQQEPRGSVAAYIKSIRRRRLRIERVRLLYVAATRARRALHLLGALRPPSQPSAPLRPAHGSPLALLWPAIGEDFLAAPLAHASPGGRPRAPSEAGAALLRLPAAWRPPSLPAPPPLQRWRSPAALPGAAPEYRWVGLTARAVGTIVHAELHRLALMQPLIEAADLAAQLPDYGAWLAELDVPPQEYSRARQRIALALERTLSDERGRWLLASDHPEARSEWRLTGVHGEHLVTVVFDRMLVDAQGERWIVDFKSSVHEGAGQEEFIEAELERYRAQLTRYAALARALGSQRVRVALYFPLLGVFRELPLPSDREVGNGSGRA